jgi:protein-S-isoprenylcysteine O-methyltransferase Ste14
LLFAGLGLGQVNAYSVLAIVVGGLLGYVWRIRVDDAALRWRFGDAYEAYRRRSWALIPPIW